MCSLQIENNNLKMSNKLVIFTEDEKKYIREKANPAYKDEKQLNDDIEIVLEWFGKQQHLPRIKLDRRLIECILISRKGSVEQTKHKIDMFFSIRNAIPELASPRDVRHIKIKNALKGCSYSVLPKLNHDFTRCIIISYKGEVDHFNLPNIINLFFMALEYRLLYDYFAGDRYIFDLSDLSLGHLTKITPTTVKYIEMYIRKAYGIRIFGMHLINGPSFLNSLISIFKAGLSEKLKGRILVHPDLEDLYKVIDKDIFPVEYGGKERSYNEIKNSWIEEFEKEDVRKFFIEQSELRSNESLRIGKSLDDDILGIAGTFKKLDVF